MDKIKPISFLPNNYCLECGMPTIIAIDYYGKEIPYEKLMDDEYYRLASLYCRKCRKTFSIDWTGDFRAKQLTPSNYKHFMHEFKEASNS